MHNNKLILIYHMVFIYIFILVSFLAVGAITKKWIFSNISKAHQNTLLGTFLLSVVTAVVGTYKNLPALKIKTSEHYAYAIEYDKNYTENFLKSQYNSDYFTCSSPKNSSNNICRKIDKDRYDLNRVINHKGIGEMFLSRDPSEQTYQGLLTYQFPNDFPIIISVGGKKIDEENIRLDFKQPESVELLYEPANVNDKLFERTFKIREKKAFSISYTKKNNNVETYIGILYHPDALIPCKDINLEIYPESISNTKKDECKIPIAVTEIDLR